MYIKNSIWHRVNAQSRNVSYRYHPPEIVSTALFLLVVEYSIALSFMSLLPCCQTLRLLAGAWFVY